MINEKKVFFTINIEVNLRTNLHDSWVLATN